jgi:hypothetical protein
MANVFSVGRNAQCAVTLANTFASTNTQSVVSGVFIPVGAIITGLRIHAPGGLTNTGAQATVIPRVGTMELATASSISALPGASGVDVIALSSTEGIYVGTSGEFNLTCGTSVNSSASGVYNYYVDYIISV